MSSPAPFTMAAEQLLALPERALFWPRRRVLFLADWHIGKDACLRALAIPVPSGTTATDLARLDSLLQTTKATTLVVLGDLLHARASLHAEVVGELRAWRERHEDLRILLVPGNHDARAGTPPASWRMDLLPPRAVLAPWILCHEPRADPHGPVLCGHLHPGARLRGPKGSALRLPCFVVGHDRIILPAFSAFTGLAEVHPPAGSRFLVVAGNRIVAKDVQARAPGRTQRPGRSSSAM